MDRSDFRMVEGEPDIRGWDIKLSNGKKVGEVEDLIVDAQKQKVRYMLVDRSHNDLDLKDDNVLIPIGLATLDQKEDDVILPGITVEQLRNLPEYNEDNLNENTERVICAAFGRQENAMGKSTHTTGSTTPHTTGSASRTPEQDDDFYRHDYFNDDNLYKNRLHEAQPASHDSDYQRGLRLWEMRSEGTVAADDLNRQREREMSEEHRMEMVRNRRRSYEERRGYPHDRNSDRYRDVDHDRDSDRRHRQDNSIEGRINREGLRDADH